MKSITKNRQKLSLAVVGLATTALLTPSLHAQPLADQLLRGVLQSVQQQIRNAQGGPAPLQQPLPPGMQPPASMAGATGSVLWPNKAAFLEATRRGELVNITRASSYSGSSEFAPVLQSLSYILASEYRVPPLPRDAAGCEAQYGTNVLILMQEVTARQVGTLSDQPPAFSREAPFTGRSVEAVVQQINGSPNCDFEGFGVRQSHPYKQALIQLMGEYGQATGEFVRAERERRKTAYLQQQERLASDQRKAQADKDNREATVRAAEQKRIDAERARIEADEKRRQEIERNRVAG